MTRRRFAARTLAKRLAEFDGKCAHCGVRVGGPAGLEWDHIVALEIGGEDEIENLQPLCRGCHKAKTRQDIAVIRKAERQRQRSAGIRRATRNPLPGSKASGWKQKITGEWERR
ncbi:MAG: HNH endonuclease signature motif containing protein [Pseudomonadota bacterium]